MVVGGGGDIGARLANSILEIGAIGTEAFLDDMGSFVLGAIGPTELHFSGSYRNGTYGKECGGSCINF